MSQQRTEWEDDSSRTQRGIAPAETSSPGTSASWAPSTPAPTPAPVPEEQRPRYKLGSRLAASGQVYEAHSAGESGSLAAAGLPVAGALAIKLLPWAVDLPADAVAAFTAEIRTVANLRHPHIVQVFRCGILDDGTPFTACERLFGETLDEKLGATSNAAIPLNEVLSIVRGVASAVSAAHAAGVVHRELRADNIFMAHLPGYEAGFPKVLDFGISRLTAAARAAGRIVAPASIAALAPEQRQLSLEAGDERADQFSLAALTYRLLTGAEVSGSMQRGGPAFERMRHGPTLGPGARNVACPPDVEAVLAQAMSLQPENRFDNLAAFFRALQTAAGKRVAHPVADPPRAAAAHATLPPPPPPPRRRPPHRHPRPHQLPCQRLSSRPERRPRHRGRRRLPRSGWMRRLRRTRSRSNSLSKEIGRKPTAGRSPPWWTTTSMSRHPASSGFVGEPVALPPIAARISTRSTIRPSDACRRSPRWRGAWSHWR